MRILLVEDNPVLSEGLSALLRGSGYAVDVVSDGASADAAIAADPDNAGIFSIANDYASEGDDTIAKEEKDLLAVRTKRTDTNRTGVEGNSC